MKDMQVEEKFSGHMENRAVRMEVEIWEGLGAIAAAKSADLGRKISVAAVIRDLALDAMKAHKARQK